MMPLTSAIAFTAFWLAVFVFGQLGWMHLTGNTRYSRVIVNWFAISVGCYLVTFMIFDRMTSEVPLLSMLAAALVGVIIMACAFVVYMPFVFVVSSSLSVDTIIMIKRNGGVLAKEAAYGKFISFDAVRRRLRMMEANGLLTVESDRYFLTPKSIRIARFFTAMKHFWKLWPGG